MHSSESRQMPMNIQDWKLKEKSAKALKTANGRLSILAKWLTTKSVPRMPETVRR